MWLVVVLIVLLLFTWVMVRASASHHRRRRNKRHSSVKHSRSNDSVPPIVASDYGALASDASALPSLLASSVGTSGLTTAQLTVETQNASPGEEVLCTTAFAFSGGPVVDRLGRVSLFEFFERTGELRPLDQFVRPFIPRNIGSFHVTLPFEVRNAIVFIRVDFLFRSGPAADSPLIPLASASQFVRVGDV